MKIKLSLFLAACCLLGAAADDIAVDNYARENIVATNGDVTVGSIFTAPNAVAIEKTGANALTVAVNAIQTREPVPVRVLEGTLNVVPGTDPGLEQPACLQRAALWLDASQSDTLVPPDGAVGDEVSRWYDVRETFGNGQWSANYYCAEAKISFVTNEVSPGVWEKVIRYPVKKTALTNGMDYVDFNGRNSGSWMRLLGMGRGDLTSLANIHHVYFSGCVSNAWGYPLGANGGQSVFWHPANFNGALAGLGANSTAPGVFSGTTRWNGMDVSPYAKTVTSGAYLHEWHAAHVLGSFGNFFNDRNIWSPANGYRAGGDALGEVVVFTNRLSAAERMAVGEYLLRKWTAAGRAPGALEISAATNTSVSVVSGVSPVLSGAGRADVADGAEAVYSAKAPTPGTLRVDSGQAMAFAGELPFAFTPGDALTVGQTMYGVLTALNEPTAALAAANEATLSLSATTSVRVASLPEGMKRLAAHGPGEVVLSAPRADGAPKAGGDIFATMPNADMEAWQSTGTSYAQNTLGTSYNWTMTSRTSGGTLYFVNLVNAEAGGGFWVIDGATKSNFRYADYPFQGKVVMAFKQGLVVENTVTFPQAGDYELTFLSAGRMINTRGLNNYAGGQVKMSLVRNGVTNEIGTAMGYVEMSTRHQRFRVRGVEAGAYTFVLNHDVGSGDAHTILDDFRFRLITEPETETVVCPPNGDFERADIAFNSRTDLSSANTVEDWTFATSGQATPDVCVLTCGMTAGVHFLDPANAWGGIQLALYGTNAVLTSSTFSLPAGTWRLRCRMGGMYCSEGWKWNTKTTTRARNLQAWLVVDGVETSLGTTGNYSDPVMVTATFNAPVTLDADKTVQLRVAQVGTEASTAVPCAIIDDLEFVRQDLHGGTVLAETFETSAGWTLKTIKDGTAYTSHSVVGVSDPCRAVPSANPTYPYAYGLMYGVNKKALEFCQCGTAEKQVSFSEAGTYRLDFSSRARVWIYTTPSMNYAGNQVAFYLVDANSVTNEFYRSPSIYSTNFVFRSALFNVPAAGTYTFGIRGLNGWPLEDGSHLKVGATASDVTVFIDQVQIKKADETAEPDIPEKLALDLSDGTRLRLDYVGTNRIDRLRLNGVSVSGFIDASHRSGLVSGIGCLEVRPKGTVLMFR
ncbi:MAG: hypothetical protein J6V72_14440 [Kiritimatiellae bacterium]|nr:hypothetical protein [Kiritimatiellia bacterium]